MQRLDTLERGRDVLMSFVKETALTSLEVREGSIGGQRQP